MQNKNLIVGFVPIARPTFDVAFAQDLTDQVYARLVQAGYKLVGSQVLVMDADAVADVAQLLSENPPDLLLVLQASFADSTMVMRLMNMVEAPLLMWALPEERTGGRLRLNSFCGINLAGHALLRAGYAYDYVYAAPDSTSALEKLHTLATASSIRRRLRTARIGRVGENPDGFETCLVNYDTLQGKFGIEIEQIQLDDVFDNARAVEQSAVDSVVKRISEQVSGVDELEPVATQKTFRAYLALSEMTDSLKLDGMAVRCWPEFFTDFGCSACGAMSLLSDEMKPSSCETDVNGTITQLILQWISDEPAFGSDLVSFDLEDDLAILWHCGLAPLSMADPDVPPEGTIHSNRKMPFLMQFPLKPGRVTLARLSESGGVFRLVVGGGEMVKAPVSFSGTSGTLRFDSGASTVMDTIMREGLEHHMALTYGDYVDTLVTLAHMLDLPVLNL
jgi:L-fucose isomerase-like protein